MEEINIWELGSKINIEINEEFLRKINHLIRKNFKSKEKFYNKLKEQIDMPYSTFRNILKYSYYKSKFYSPLNVFIMCCKKLNISNEELQRNIISYKTQGGYNIIEKPILPIKITPIFDMIIAHNIADGTVINPKRKRQIYFGYRQLDRELRELYIKKIESIFGKIRFKKEGYYKRTTRPYCPAVLSQLFFKFYNLNDRDFLSKQARIPREILNKDKDYLLAVLLAFIIDEGNIDSTLICIRLKNPKLTGDLYEICKKMNYDATFKIKGEYGSLYIKRDGMKKLFKDYKRLIKKYPEVYLSKFHRKIEDGFKIYDRIIYKIKGNRDIILKMLKSEDLTVNQIANRINMTRQGVRFHIHNLERMNKITKKGFIGEGNIRYSIIGDKLC